MPPLFEARGVTKRFGGLTALHDVDFALERGIASIIGPNGAGKTTILEAIAWAMYGMPAARGNRETIPRRGAPARR